MVVQHELEALQREVERLRAVAGSEGNAVLQAILEHSPHGIIVADASGALVLHSVAAERIWAGSSTSRDVEGWGAYRAFHPDGRPYAPSDWSMAACLATKRPVETHEVRILRFDGSPGWLLASAAPLFGAGGELRGAIAVFADITRLKEIELETQRLRSAVDAQHAQLRAIARRAARLQGMTYDLGRAMTSSEVGEIVCLHAQDLFAAGGVMFYLRSGDEVVLSASVGIEETQRLTQVVPIDPATPLGLAMTRRLPVWLPTRAAFLADFPHLAPKSRLDGKDVHGIIAVPLEHDGASVGALACVFFASVELDEIQRDFYLVAAEQAAQALHRARLFEIEQRARRNAQRREERAAVIARAAAVVAHTSDAGTALRELVRVAVPELADWCTIDELGVDGVVRRVALHHRRPEMLELARVYQERYPDDPNAASGIYAVMRSGRREFVGEITEAMILAGVRDEGHLALVRELRLTSYAVVPMMGRSGVVGTLSLVGEGDRHLDAEDVAAAEELARIAGFALETERLIAAAEYERARLEALVEATATVVWTAAPSGEVTEVSPSWLAFTGQPPAAYVGYGWLDALHPEDRARTGAVWRAAVEAQGLYAVEYRLRRADGTLAHTLARALPVRDRDGVVREYMGCNIDVTPQRQAEAEARAHAETLATLNELGRVISAELDQHKLVQAVTDAATSLCGAQFGAFFYNVVDESGGSFQLYTISGVPRERFAHFPMPRNTAVFAPTFSGEGVVRARDITQDPRYGRQAPHHGMPEGHLPVRSYLAVPVCSRSGEVLGGIFLGHADVGVFDERAETIAAGLAAQAAVAVDNARLYGEATRLIKALEQSNRDLDQFAYVASHDLKAPLRGIASLSTWLEEDLGKTATPEMRSNMELLRGRVKRMEALINGILSYSRVGRTSERRESVDVGKLLAETSELLGVKAPAAVHIGEGMPSLWTDRTKLQQVFLNLIGNALKHAARPDVVVRVEARDTGALWEFAVADNGPGIAPEYQARIWGIFQTLQQRDKVESTGIGLAIVKKIVETREGTVRVESDGANGTTFVFTWPRGAGGPA